MKKATAVMAAVLLAGCGDVAPKDRAAVIEGGEQRQGAKARGQAVQKEKQERGPGGQIDRQISLEEGRTVTLTDARVTGGGVGIEAFDPDPEKVPAGLELLWRGWKVTATFGDLEDLKGADRGALVTVKGKVTWCEPYSRQLVLRDCAVGRVGR